MLFSLDLNSPFPVETLLTPSFVQNTTVPFNARPRELSGYPDAGQGALFATNDSFLVYAKDDPSASPDHTLVSYNVSARQWGSTSLSGGNFQNNPQTAGMGASDPVSGLSFFIGGWDGIGGLLKIDTSDSSWANENTRIHSTEDVFPRIGGGGLVYLPIGKAGILLLIGGYNVSPQFKFLGAMADTMRRSMAGRGRIIDLWHI